MAAPELSLRPVRPADRGRVLELVADVWDGHDYIPGVFDEWVAEPAASFQAAEIDGVLVGLQRLRPLSGKVLYYEGLRVASTHQRQGIARAMLRSAIAEASAQGFEVLRLVTGNPNSARLFESEGFRVRTQLRNWSAPRSEGGEPPRMAGPQEAAAVLERLLADPAFAAYGGLLFDWSGPLDLDLEEVRRGIAAGAVRVGGGGRSIAFVRVAESSRRLVVTVISGSGGSFQDLLGALRFEADGRDLDRVVVIAPADHPAADDLRAVGYDLPDDEAGFTIHELRLRS